ncbi:MAG: universal stress protein [Halobacteriaceae archaeon]
MKFLVAVDGSDASDDALAYATDIADAMDAQITAVHAVNPAVFEEAGTDPIESFAEADRSLIMQSVEDAEERGLDILAEAEKFAADLGTTIEMELLHGPPVRAITDYAEDAEFDAIFVGHRGRSEHRELMLGSVAKDLVTRATVPVTVVR